MPESPGVQDLRDPDCDRVDLVTAARGCSLPERSSALDEDGSGLPDAGRR